MFIQDSKKLKHVSLSVGAVMALYLSINVGLMAIAGNVERQLEVYPWRDEDVLRYMLPSMFAEGDRERLWLVGPSEAREDLLAWEFEEQFPSLQTYQGALSLGTLDDFLLTLEYVERAFGQAAMPKVMVLGLTPRFVANIPRTGSPLIAAIDRYSPTYKVIDGQDGPTLKPKLLTQGLASRARFMMKQQKRFKAGLIGQALRYSPVLRENGSASQIAQHASNEWMSYLYKPQGTLDFVDRKLRIYTMPYKYHNLRPMRSEAMAKWMNAPSSFWFKVHQWQPDDDAVMIRTRLARLLTLVERLDIELYFVNLPEHPMNRKGYLPGRYERYQMLVSNALGDAPFLDLRNLLEAKEFYDVGHATLAGARRVTSKVIAFLKNRQASSVN